MSNKPPTKLYVQNTKCMFKIHCAPAKDMCTPSPYPTVRVREKGEGGGAGESEGKREERERRDRDGGRTRGK